MVWVITLDLDNEGSIVIEVHKNKNTARKRLEYLNDKNESAFSIYSMEKFKLQTKFVKNVKGDVE